VTWNDKFGISNKTHPEYFKEFGEAFYNLAKKQIDKAKNSKSCFDSLNINDKELLFEIVDHAYLCKANAVKFFGRQKLLQRVS
jgi:hypothetical protein